MPTANPPPLPSCNNQTCLQTLSKIPWEAKSSPGKNHWYKICSQNTTKTQWYKKENILCQNAFLLEMQNWFNIQWLTIAVLLIIQTSHWMWKKYLTNFSIFIIKTLSKLRIESNFPNLKKGTHNKPTINITLTDERMKAFT